MGAHTEHATQDSPFGYALAVLALFLDVLRWVLLQKIFSIRAEPAESPHAASQESRLRMVAKVMFASLPVCFVLSMAFEAEAFPRAMEDFVPVSLLVLALSIGVLGINLAEFGVVQWTSAVTFNVLAQIHTIPLVLAGVLF